MSETYIDVNPADVRVGDEVKVDGYGFVLLAGSATPMRFINERWYSVETADKNGDVVFGGEKVLGKMGTSRSSIVAARRRVEVVPPRDACQVWINDRWMCSLRKDHEGDHIKYESHKIGCKELGRAPNQPKAAESIHGPTPCYHCDYCKRACDGLVCCHCKAHKPDAHTPKEPKRDEVARWPIEAPEPSPNGNLPGDWATCICRVWVYHGQRCPKTDGFEAQRRVYRSTGWSKDTRTGQPRVLKPGDPVEVVIKGQVGELTEALDRACRAYKSASGCFIYPYEDGHKRAGLDIRPIGRRAGDKGGSK